MSVTDPLSPSGARPAPHPVAPGSGVARSHRTARIVSALMLREMSTRYGRSPGGYLWAILEPLGGVLILSLAFSLLLRTPSLGTSFILFYATGFVPFNLYQNVSTTVARALNFSKPLMQYPVVTWGDAVLARFVLNALVGILVAYVVLSLITVFVDAHVLLDIAPILKVIGLTLLMGLAVGVLNCVLLGLFGAWETIWAIVTRPLFIASGVLFTYEDVPASVQGFLWYNPLIHITGLMRQGFYSTYSPSYISELYVICTCLTVLFLGTVLLRRYHRDILNH
ncbi:ABC transporter permease [Roseovarius nanhaiticus]|uniref:ABC transporter permease n=1 Tax=Roseovarius nanhaiticus TaxID=573024 RepID=UPI0024907930|nr:ABC transporter permease [Roseovarius nanhaiticus]